MNKEALTEEQLEKLQLLADYDRIITYYKGKTKKTLKFNQSFYKNNGDHVEIATAGRDSLIQVTKIPRKDIADIRIIVIDQRKPITTKKGKYTFNYKF